VDNVRLVAEHSKIKASNSNGKEKTQHDGNGKIHKHWRKLIKKHDLTLKKS
jgi:hypothetical protein